MSIEYAMSEGSRVVAEKQIPNMHCFDWLSKGLTRHSFNLIMSAAVFLSLREVFQTEIGHEKPGWKRHNLR